MLKLRNETKSSTVPMTLAFEKTRVLSSRTVDARIKCYLPSMRTGIIWKHIFTGLNAQQKDVIGHSDNDNRFMSYERGTSGSRKNAHGGAARNDKVKLTLLKRFRYTAEDYRYKF